MAHIYLLEPELMDDLQTFFISKNIIMSSIDSLENIHVFVLQLSQDRTFISEKKCVLTNELFSQITKIGQL